MKKIFTLFNCSCIVLLGLISINSYSQDILWEKSYGGKNAEYLFDAQPTADYGFILAGSSLSIPFGTKSENNKGKLDFFIDNNSFLDEKHKKSKK